MTNDLFGSSLRLTQNPYSIKSWLVRARIYLKLGFPDLALGDCYRAELLLDAEMKLLRVDEARTNTTSIDNDKDDSSVGSTTSSSSGCDCKLKSVSRWLMAQRVAFLSRLQRRLLRIQARALATSNCFIECAELCHQGLEMFADASDLKNLLGTVQPYCDRKRKMVNNSAICNASAQSKNTDTDVGLESNRIKVETEEKCREGSTSVPRYPWMLPALSNRPPGLVSTLASWMNEASEMRCTVAEVTDNTSETGSKVCSSIVTDSTQLYVCATTRIPCGQVILLEPTVIGTGDSFWSEDRCVCCFGPLAPLEEVTKLPCCAEIVCSQACLSRALELYHPAVCGRDLSDFYDLDKTPDLSADARARMQVLLRMLAVVVHDQQKREVEEATYCEAMKPSYVAEATPLHPLQAKIINHLQGPPSEVTDPIVFSYRDNIVHPFKILKALGRNIFQDSSFDTWVIQMIISRLNNNQHGKDVCQIRGNRHMALSPLYSLFNHSCHPNVVYQEVNNSTTIQMRACRDIREGEELVINYLTDVSDAPLEVRRRQLRPWIGRECQCGKCVKESER